MQINPEYLNSIMHSVDEWMKDDEKQKQLLDAGHTPNHHEKLRAILQGAEFEGSLQLEQILAPIENFCLSSIKAADVTVSKIRREHKKATSNVTLISKKVANEQLDLLREESRIISQSHHIDVLQWHQVVCDIRAVLNNPQFQQTDPGFDKRGMEM